jgi:hypothetical protein
MLPVHACETLGFIAEDVHLNNSMWPVHDEDDHVKDGPGQLLGRKQRRACDVVCHTVLDGVRTKVLNIYLFRY